MGLIINPDELQKLNKSKRRIPILKTAIAKERASNSPNQPRIDSLNLELSERSDFVKKIITELQVLIEE